MCSSSATIFMAISVLFDGISIPLNGPHATLPPGRPDVAWLCVMSRKDELRDFLRSRRGRLRPEAVGLPASGRRRVEGLRREEVASLAGVSADYYTRLEQGRDLVPSIFVLDAIARALMLDDVEREHFHCLVNSVDGTTHPACGAAAVPHVRPEIRQLLAFVGAPAMVVGRGTAILAANAHIGELMTDFEALPPEERFYAHWLFLDPSARAVHAEHWETYARACVGVLRREAAVHPNDPRLQELIGRLGSGSAQFRGWWAAHSVDSHHHGSKHYRHPEVGPMTVAYEPTKLSDPDQWLYVYWAEPGSPSEAALRQLLTRTDAGRPQPPPRRSAGGVDRGHQRGDAAPERRPRRP
jgi:transcriptional regulator with XRE-family HTH domain